MIFGVNVRLKSTVETSRIFDPGAISPSRDTMVEFHSGYVAAVVTSLHTVSASALIMGDAGDAPKRGAFCCGHSVGVLWPGNS